MITFIRHDVNSSQDLKILKCLRVHGNKGFGIYWRLIEMLASGDGKLDTDYDSLAWELREEPDTIKSIINDFGLFVVEDGVFYSQRLNKELDNFNEKAEKAKISAKLRWEKKKEELAKLNSCDGNANAMRTQCERIEEPIRTQCDSNANAMRTQCDGNAIRLDKIRLDKIRLDKIRLDKNNNNPPLSPLGETGKKNDPLPELPQKFNTPEFLDAWEKWEKYRKEKRQSLKASTVKLQIEFLSKFDVTEAIEIINQSIRNGWTGLFELKKQNNSNRSTSQGNSKPNNPEGGLFTPEKIKVMEEFLNGD